MPLQKWPPRAHKALGQHLVEPKKTQPHGVPSKQLSPVNGVMAPSQEGWHLASHLLS